MYIVSNALNALGFIGQRHEPTELTLDEARLALDYESKDAVVGSQVMNTAITRAKEHISAPNARKAVMACFQDTRDKAPPYYGQIIRSHIAAVSAEGDRFCERESSALAVLEPLLPELRAEMVARWSASENTSIYVTPANRLAVDIPGLGFRCILPEDSFFLRGLKLHQSEATQFLMAHLDGDRAGTPVLEVLPDVVKADPMAVACLLRAAIGTDGRLLPYIEATKIHQLAMLVHDSVLRHGSVELHEGFAEFLKQMGDHHRAAQLRQMLAGKEARLANAGLYWRDTTFEQVRYLRSPEIERVMYRSAGVHRAESGTHFAKVGKPQAAVTEFRLAAECFNRGNAWTEAARQHARAAEQLAHYVRFTSLKPTLDMAVNGLGIDHHEIHLTCERCADAFAKRGLLLSAALMHEFAADYLKDLHKRGIGADEVGVLAATHQSAARNHFVNAGCAPASANTPDIIRSAIEARLSDLTQKNGISRNDAVIKFDGACDFISSEAFERHAPTQWVLLRVSGKGVPVYQLISEGSRQMLLDRKEPHPSVKRTLTEKDFLTGFSVVEMLWPAQAQPVSKSEGLHQDTLSTTH